MKLLTKLAVVLALTGSHVVLADGAPNQEPNGEEPQTVNLNPGDFTTTRSIRVLTEAEFNSNDPITVGKNQTLIINCSYKPQYLNNDKILILLSHDPRFTISSIQGEVNQNTGIMPLRILCFPIAVGDTTLSLIVEDKTLKDIKLHIVEYVE